LNKYNSAKIKALHSESEQTYPIVLVDPQFCFAWDLSNRACEFVSEQSCAYLIESIKANGQQIPVLVREHPSKEGYELICGVRRLFACQYLGIKIKVAIVDLSDKDALLAMDAENRHREDISPYERACDYKRWIKSGIYNNYSEIIAALGVKKSWFSQLIALSDLQAEVVAAFGHPANLKQKWGYELQRLCKKSNALEVAMVSLAKELSGQSRLPVDIYKKLVNLHHKESEPLNIAPTIIKDGKNNNLFEVKYMKSGRQQFVFSMNLPVDLLEKIIHATKDLLLENKA